MRLASKPAAPTASHADFSGSLCTGTDQHGRMRSKRRLQQRTAANSGESVTIEAVRAWDMICTRDIAGDEIIKSREPYAGSRETQMPMTTMTDDRRVRAAVGVASATFLFSHGPGLRGRRFPGLRSDLFPAAGAAGTFSAPPSVLTSRHRVLRLVAVLRVPGAGFAAVGQGRTASRSVGLIGVSLATAMTIFGFHRGRHFDAARRGSGP